MTALTRWFGKPYSGRIVYAGTRHLIDGRWQGREWWWQCDLCGAPDEGGDPGPYSSQPEAFAAALAHATVCVAAGGTS